MAGGDEGPGLGRYAGWFAGIAVLRALNRRVVRAFSPDRNLKRWGKLQRRRRQWEPSALRHDVLYVAVAQLVSCSWCGTLHFNLRAVGSAFNSAYRAGLHFTNAEFLTRYAAEQIACDPFSGDFPDALWCHHRSSSVLRA
jgi:hypothetical protein